MLEPGSRSPPAGQAYFIYDNIGQPGERRSRLRQELMGQKVSLERGVNLFFLGGL